MNNTKNTSPIRIDQNGYSDKLPAYIAVLSDSPVKLFDALGNLVRSYEDYQARPDAASGDNVASINLGVLPAGEYRISCGDASRKISVSDKPFDKLTDSLVKALYFQRCGCALKEKYAGSFTHAACHTAPASEWENNSVKKTIHGGWHDAGDYGKYVGPGAVTVAHMLYTWKLFPSGCSDDVNIPESGNGTPDILNEARFELDWILKMQREDGAFYHKLTKAKFAPFLMPEDDLEPEFLIPVSHCATGAAVAVLALASRIYFAFDPKFADEALEAAIKGYKWLVDNPDFIPFRNPEGVNTGMYGDWSVKDELFWACCELFAATGEREYITEAENLYRSAKIPMPDIEQQAGDPAKASSDSPETIVIDKEKIAEDVRNSLHDIGIDETEFTFFPVLVKERESFIEVRKRFKAFVPPVHAPGLNLTSYGWSDVSGLGAICCIFDLKENAGPVLFDELKQDFLERSEPVLARVNASGYRTALYEKEYVWGSNMNVMCNSMTMLLNYLLTGRNDMLEGSLSQLDYALGVNALDISFITGFGENKVMNPHHRPSGSDNIEEPVPGFVVGGPNKAWTYPETKERLKETPAAKYYLDELPSADTNEIAIYWNSPAIFVASYFNSL